MSKIIPILRVFDYDKAIEFYINWLGFKVDWQHMPDGLPIYFQISLRDIAFNLSEHHGDASPGSHIRILGFEGLKEYHKTLIDQKYKYNRPGLNHPEWNPDAIEMTVHDPFGNRITFVEESPL
jgi:catechol 2,3-dioxygenase-like lactoylglutathione lyase family enzyme